MEPKSKVPILEQAAQCFNVSVSQLSPLVGGHYAQVYEWTESHQCFVLKISPAENSREIQALQSMLDWLAYLAANHAHVVQHISSQHGNLIEPIEHDGKTYLVTAAHKVLGVRAETLLLDQWDASKIQMLGRVLGRCHALGQLYSPSKDVLRRPVWDQAENCFNPIDDLAIADEFLLEKRAQILKRIQQFPKDHTSYGLAHLDIHFANIVVDLQTRHIVLLDFDDCAYGWYAMDIAMILFDVLVVYQREAPSDFHRYFLAELLQGYRKETEFSELWVAELPAFLKLLEIGLYAMLSATYDSKTCDDDWVNTFMSNRERRIREDIPYLDHMD